MRPVNWMRLSASSNRWYVGWQVSVKGTTVGNMPSHSGLSVRPGAEQWSPVPLRTTLHIKDTRFSIVLKNSFASSDELRLFSVDLGYLSTEKKRMNNIRVKLNCFSYKVSRSLLFGLLSYIILNLWKCVLFMLYYC